MEPLFDFFDTKYFGNTVTEWCFAVGAFAVTFTVLPLLKKYLMLVAKRHSHASELALVQIPLRLIPRTSRIFVLVVALNAALRFVDFSNKIERAFEFLIQVGLWFQIGLWAIAIFEYLLERKARADGQSDAGFASSMGVVSFIANLIIWAVVALLALDNMGVNITALVAGMGIGGIAIALAVQALLGDLFASLSITFDKPFAVGDSLNIDNINGKVEQIGIRTTRLRSIDGEQVIISNTDLVKGRVRNFGRMGERRGVIAIAVSYETSAEKVRKAGQIIEEAIKAQKSARLERCYLKELSANSINFEAVFFVADGNFDTLTRTQQDINFRILENFEREEIVFAHPLQRALTAKA